MHCKYKPGDVVGSRTLIRSVGHGDWEARCVCGSVSIARAHHFRRTGGCRNCDEIYRSYMTPIPPPPRPRAALKPEPVIASRDQYRPQIPDIRKAVCNRFGLSLADLYSPKRRYQLAHPRQLAMTLARELTENSLPYIGRQFGGRDHTTVLAAIRSVRHRIVTKPEWARHYEALRLELDIRATIEIENTP